MATIKSYTDEQQSKKLAEILPLESAAMCYVIDYAESNKYGTDHFKLEVDTYGLKVKTRDNIPCWSLASLLGVLPFHLIVNNQRYAFSMHKGLNKNGETYVLRYNVFNTDVCLYTTDYYNNPVDACVEMITRLNEMNLL